MRSLVITLLLLCLAGSINAATLNVPADYGTIAAALTAAEAGDIVMVACGLYQESGLVMKSGVTLTSNTGGGFCAIIDGGGAARVIECTDVDAAASIVGFTIKSGYTAGKGGGILFDNSSPSVENCIIRNNEAEGGGGGIACLNGSAPTFTLTTITSNTASGAGHGGGVLLEDASPSFYDCIIENNTTSADGGGVYADNSPFSIGHSNINENTATGQGAGLVLANGADAELNLITFYGNYSGGLGGGINIVDSAPDITSCTIAENGSSTGGSGVAIGGASTVAITKCIIAFNTLVEGFRLDAGATTIVCTDIFGNVNEQDAYNWAPAIFDQKEINFNLSADPRFCGTNSSGNYYLQSNSPCSASSACGELIGSRIVDCGIIATQEQDWGTIKSMY